METANHVECICQKWKLHINGIDRLRKKVMTGASTEKQSHRRPKEYLKIFGPAFLLTLIGFIVAYQFVQPAPPKHVTIGTGSKTGAYYPFGLRYSEILARDGITLEVLSTAGSIENIKLLEADEGGVQVAFAQGGVGDPKAHPDLTTLGSLYFEPLWVFYRSDQKINDLFDLKNKRVAIGKEGSGTRVIALQLMAENGITEEGAALLPIGGQQAADALLNREIDVAFFVVSPRSSIIRRLMTHEDIELMSFERAEAYTRIHRFLSSVTLPEGVIDFKTNIPDHDIILLAPTTNLVIRKDLHPALIDLFLQAAGEIHGQGGVFEEIDQFPSQKYLDFPLHKEARRFFKSGPPFLQRYLPFWAATLIDRLKVMLIPLITLLIPLMKIIPPSYRWRIRYRIFHWYRELIAIDQEVGRIDMKAQFGALLSELERIDKEVMQVNVPLSYAAELYSLRLHIAYVRDRIKKRKEIFQEASTEHSQEAGTAAV